MRGGGGGGAGLPDRSAVHGEANTHACRAHPLLQHMNLLPLHCHPAPTALPNRCHLQQHQARTSGTPQQPVNTPPRLPTPATAPAPSTTMITPCYLNSPPWTVHTSCLPGRRLTAPQAGAAAATHAEEYLGDDLCTRRSPGSRWVQSSRESMGARGERGARGQATAGDGAV
jgi:hypothetical protein